MKWYLFDSRIFCAMYKDYSLIAPSNRGILEYCGVQTEEDAKEHSDDAAVLRHMQEQEWYPVMQALTRRCLDLQQSTPAVGEVGVGAVALLDRYIHLLGQVWVEQEYCTHRAALAQEAGAVDARSSSLLQSNTALLATLGYYGSGLVEHSGTWYPCNRLHHLERKLSPSSSSSTPQRVWFDKEVDSYMRQPAQYRHDNCLRFQVPEALIGSEADPCGDVIEVFYSFRSPYSQLVLDRVLHLCAAYGKKLLFRPVLPMVARKLKVPASKVMYIARDAIREARGYWNIPFGCIADPGTVTLLLRCMLEYD